MEILQPSNFKDLFDIITSIITGLVALVGVYYAVQTYFIAKEAKEEWKIQKDLDFYLRFSRIMAYGKDYIKFLRNPVSFSQEILPKYLQNFIKDDKINHDSLRPYYLEYIILSRREGFLDKIKEVHSLLAESILYFDDDHPIPQFLNFIINTEETIVRKSGIMSINNVYLSSENTTPESVENYTKENIEIQNIVMSLPYDSINKRLESLFDKCSSILREVKNKTAHR